MLEPQTLRSQFPGLYSSWALFDNAGGTVPCTQVIERVHDYMATDMVQHGASYEPSVRAARAVTLGREAMASMMGVSAEDVLLGSSSTELLSRLARSVGESLGPGDEVVVTNLDHEANVGCWRRMAEQRGATVREWRFDTETLGLNEEGLNEVLTDRTRVVAFGHVSNLIGQIHDVPALCARVRAAGALSVVDGVAYAPHRRPDVRKMGVDAYAFSTYKVFGPHQAALWVDPQVELPGLSHFFVDSRSGGLEPGGVVHELVAGLPGIVEYLQRLAPDVQDPDERLDAAFDWIAAQEAELSAPLATFLEEHPRVRLIGPTGSDPAVRVPTFSFTVEGLRASEVPTLMDAHQVAIRWGHFYAYRAAQDLGLLEQDGVVRASLVHYNTQDEVRRLIEGLNAVLDRSLVS